MENESMSICREMKSLGEDYRTDRKRLFICGQKEDVESYFRHYGPYVITVEKKHL